MRRNIQDIQAILPHRDPILLVERVTIKSPGECGQGRVGIPHNVPFFAELASGDLRRELVLEGAAQAFGIVLATGQNNGCDPREGKHLLLGFDRVTFLAEPLPGELQVEVQLEQTVGGICRGQFSAHQNGAMIAAGFLSVLRG